MPDTICREFMAHPGTMDDAAKLGGIIQGKGLNALAQAELLCGALPTGQKELARNHYRLMVMEQNRKPAPMTGEIQQERARMSSLGLDRSIMDALQILPPYSLGIELTFKLARPYLSRDDTAFYIIDNPVRKDKVFKVPYVAPASWKGSLRAASLALLLGEMGSIMSRHGQDLQTDFQNLKSSLWAARAQHVLLFGNEDRAQGAFIDSWLANRLLPPRREETQSSRGKRLQNLQDELAGDFTDYLKAQGYRTERIEGRQGRLFFFPSYFDTIGLEIINPHDRQRGVGTNPILLECAPAGTASRFSLLYVPFDFPTIKNTSLPTVTPDEDSLRRQVAHALPLLADAIGEMLTNQGFGAKTSSGFGSAEDALVEPGIVLVNASVPELETQPAYPSSLLADPGQPVAMSDLVLPEGDFRSEEQYKELLREQGLDYPRRKKQEYRRVRKWWEEGGRTIYRQTMSAQVSGSTRRHFSSLTELPRVAREVSVALDEGGANG